MAERAIQAGHRARVKTADLVFRIPERKLNLLRALCNRTRVMQSEYLREAVADLLEKYAEQSQ